MSEWLDAAPRARLALWAGWRYYRRLAMDHPEDFRQSAALLALSASDLADNKQAFRFITRGFSRVCRSYGYRYHPQAGWIRYEEYARVRPDYVCACGRQSFSAVRCDACRSRDYRKRQPKKPRRETAPKPLPAWTCAHCGKSFEKARGRMRARQDVYFCSTACYRAARAKEVWRLAARANIRIHAVARFRARVIDWPDARAEAAIRRGLSAPAAMARKRNEWEATCKVGSLEFRVRLARNAENGFDATTVLESLAENERMRQERKSRRDRNRKP